MNPPVRAVIDIGSNSIKCVVVQGVGPASRIVWETNQVTRLGEELARTGKIGTKAAERNLEFLQEVSSVCQSLDVTEILCVGAETLRQAGDAELFASQLKCRTGWNLHILTPEEEASLSFEAAAELLPGTEPFLVLDSGGGSTEFSFGRDSQLQSSLSLPLGALIHTRGFIPSDPPDQEELLVVERQIQNFLQTAFPHPEPLHAVACGGGVNAMAAVALVLDPFDASLVQGFWLSREEIRRQIRLYRLTTTSERSRIMGLPPGREEIILASALILQGIAKHFALEGVKVCSRGIRHALLGSKYQDRFQIVKKMVGPEGVEPPTIRL